MFFYNTKSDTDDLSEGFLKTATRVASSAYPARILLTDSNIPAI